MKIIKHLKEDKVELNGVVYKPYTICNLPPSFGEYEEDEEGNKYALIDKWFNYKGYTYLFDSVVKS